MTPGSWHGEITLTCLRYSGVRVMVSSLKALWLRRIQAADVSAAGVGKSIMTFVYPVFPDIVLAHTYSHI
jgi:hypothetical protein